MLKLKERGLLRPKVSVRRETRNKTMRPFNLLVFVSPMDDETIGSGRGRGRGRGAGVPVLPVGMWNEINNTDETKTKNMNNEPEQFGSLENDRTLEEMKQMTFGGFGRGRGKSGMSSDRGPGFVRDAKGADWACPSCGNVNWSWRTNCNRCSTAKPVVKVGSSFPLFPN
jgi:hypothetical protein